VNETNTRFEAKGRIWHDDRQTTANNNKHITSAIMAPALDSAFEDYMSPVTHHLIRRESALSVNRTQAITIGVIGAYVGKADERQKSCNIIVKP
jgi:hypothetical protein